MAAWESAPLANPAPQEAPSVPATPAWASAPAVDAQAAQPQPQRSMGEDIARQAGLTARAPFTGVGNLAEMFLTPARSLVNLGNAAVERLTGMPQARLQNTGGIPRALDVLFPAPENAGERVAQDVAGALATSGGIGALSRFMGAPLTTAAPVGATPSALASAPQNLSAAVGSPVGKGLPADTMLQYLNPATLSQSSVGARVLQSLGSNMGAQAAATMAGTGAAGVTREAGGGPLAQLLAGLAGGVAAPMAGSFLANASSPQRALGASMAKSEQTPFAQEGERLAQTTGVQLTPSARTGNRWMTAMENTARQYSQTADKVQDIDVKIANQAIQRVEQIANRIGTAQNPEALGDNIRATVQRAARSLDDARTAQANRDYGYVREIAGDGKVIRLQSFADELKKIVDDFSNVAGADAQKITAQASAALRRITGTIEPGQATRDIVTPAGGRIRLYGEAPVTGTLDNTISEALRTRSFYGKASRGAANVFEDIAPDMQRTLASRLFRAINDDFDGAASTANGPLKQALSDANANFRKSSQSIEFLEKSALGKMIGDDLVDAALSGKTVNTTAGESVVQKLVSMHPSVRQQSIEIIEQSNPALAANVRSNFLREALEAGKAMPPSVKGSRQVPISFNRLLSSLGSEKVGFERTLQSYGFKPNEIDDINDIAAAMLRQGDRTGTNFSGTTPAAQNAEMADLIGNSGMALATGGFSGLIRSGGSQAIKLVARRQGMEKIANLMANPEGRAALKTISSPSASPQALLQAFAVVEEEPKK